MPSMLQKMLLFSGGATAAQLYEQRVLATSPLQLLKMNETSGTTALDATGNSRTGAYTGVTLNSVASPFAPDFAPRFDGANDDLNDYTASLSTAWNWDEGCVMVWAKVSAAGIWTDGLTHQLVRFRSDGSATDDITIRKTGTNNQIDLSRKANGATKAVTVTLSSPTTAWYCFMLEWSLAGDYLKAYANGVQIGTTQTGLGAHGVAGLLSSETHIGSANNALDWDGYLAYFAAWDSPADATRIALGVA